MKPACGKELSYTFLASNEFADFDIFFAEALKVFIL